MAIPRRCFIPMEKFPAFFFPVVEREHSFSRFIINSWLQHPSIKAFIFRLSYAVSAGYKPAFSIRVPTRRKINGSSFGCFPNSFNSPSVACSIPLMSFIMVDLPAPLGPIRPVIEPFFIWNETWSTAVKLRNFFVNALVSTIHSFILSFLPCTCRL